MSSTAQAQAQALLFVYGEPTPHISEDKFNDWYDNEHAPARAHTPGFLSVSRYKAKDVKIPTWLALYDMTSVDVLKSGAYKSLAGAASENERETIRGLSVLDRRVYSLVSTIGTGSGNGTGNGNSGVGNQAAAGVTAAKFIYVVHAQVKDGGEPTNTNAEEAEKAFLQWYTNTRVPLLQTVPGWSRSRVYKLEEQTEMGGKADSKDATGIAVALTRKSPMKYLFLHEFSTEGEEVIGSVQFRGYMTTTTANLDESSSDSRKPQAWGVVGESAVAEMEDRMFGLYKSFEVSK